MIFKKAKFGPSYYFMSTYTCKWSEDVFPLRANYNGITNGKVTTVALKMQSTACCLSTSNYNYNFKIIFYKGTRYFIDVLILFCIILQIKYLNRFKIFLLVNNFLLLVNRWISKNSWPEKVLFFFYQKYCQIRSFKYMLITVILISSKLIIYKVWNSLSC